MGFLRKCSKFSSEHSFNPITPSVHKTVKHTLKNFHIFNVYLTILQVLGLLGLKVNFYPESKFYSIHFQQYMPEWLPQS